MRRTDRDPEASVLDLATQILESAAAQHEALANDDVFDLLSDAEECARTSSEYLLLRLALVCTCRFLTKGDLTMVLGMATRTSGPC